MAAKNRKELETDKVLPFLMAGNSTLTLVSKASGTRYTYQVKAKKTEDETTELWFVSLLTGSDNTSDYSCIGIIVPAGDSLTFRKTRKANWTPSVNGFQWLFKTLSAGNHSKVAEQAETWHEGKCGRCNRKLTVPESIESGLGPVCSAKQR